MARSLAAVTVICGMLTLPLTLSAQICPNIPTQGSTSTSAPQPPMPPPPGDCALVSVTPDGAREPVRTPNTSGYNAVFTVTNTGDSADSYFLNCSSTTPWVACTGWSPTQLTLNPGQSANVTVFYNVGPTGRGIVTFGAGGVTFGGYDDGVDTIPVWDAATMAAPSVIDLSGNNAFNLAKERCLTFQVGQGLVQCGDYVLVHATPSFRTFDHDRGPTLVYNAGMAEVRPIVHAAVTFPGSGPVPDYFSLALFFDGAQTASASAFYKPVGYDETLDETRRMSVVFNADAVQSGIYPYVLEARSWYEGSSRVRSSSGNMIVVNRKTSPYGAGWWLAGLERSYFRANGDALVVFGDGSAKLFTRNPDGTFTAPTGEYSRFAATEGGWDRILRGGGRVHFDATARHVYTEDDDGNRTTFVYSPSIERVETIRVEATQVTWILGYGANGILSSITDPAGRTTQLNSTSDGRITALYHADGAYRQIDYASGRFVPAAIWDERRNKDSVWYDDMSRPYQVRRPALPTVGSPILAMRSAAVQGTSSLNASQSTAIVPLRLDAIADTLIDPKGGRTLFRTNLFGEPTRIEDAVAQVTDISRDPSSNPTRVRFPNGRVLRLTWNNGLPTELWDSTYAGDHGLTGLAKVNLFYEDAACPYDVTRVTKQVTASEALTARSTYDPPGGTFRGCRLRTATDERGHVTEFSYLLDGRLSTVTEKAVPAGSPAAGTGAYTRDLRTTLEYHSLTDANLGNRGNLARVKALHPGLVVAQGYPSTTDTLVTTQLFYDGYGNLNQQVDGAGHTVWQTFSVRNLRTWARVRANTSSQTRDIDHVFTYDSTGNLLVVKRPVYAPGTGADQRHFTYNVWNLVEGEYDEANYATVNGYDLAGNVVQITTRNGHVLTSTYDPLNRLTQQVIPAATQPYPGESQPFTGYPPARTIAADTLRWHYDRVGNVDTARTRTGYVARAYFLDGTLRSELQQVGGRNHLLTYTYDLAGRRTRLDHPTTLDSVFGTRRTDYAHVGADLRSLTNPVAETTTFWTDAMGRLDSLVYPNRVRERRYYNDAGNLDYQTIKSDQYLAYKARYGGAFLGAADTDSLIYWGRPVYDADGFIKEQLVAQDARTFLNRAFYDQAHRLMSVFRDFQNCRYEDVEGLTWQHCGRFFHKATPQYEYAWYDYDARGNQTQHDREWVHLGRDDGEGAPGWPGYYEPFSSCEVNQDQTFNARSQQDTIKIALSRLIGLANVPCGQTSGGTMTIASYLTGDKPLVQTFDRIGNLRARYNQTRTNASAGNIAWDWDFFYYSANDRLARSIISPDPMRYDNCVVWLETSYEYDALGRRIRKVMDMTAGSNQACDPLKDKDITYEYVYDGDAVLYERIIEAWGPQNPQTPNQTKVIEALYTRTPGGAAISRRVPTAVPYTNSAGRTPERKSMFYHLNGQNTPIAATDTAGYRFEMPEWQVRSTYITVGGLNEFLRPDWEGFDVDNPIDAGPSSWTMGFRFYRLDQRGALDVENTVGFAGQPYDPETGLSYFRYRYYDSRTGRFTQEDPIGLAGGLNLYQYAGNNPVTFSDPFGLCPYGQEKRDTNVDDCPEDKLGNAVRLLKKHGGDIGAETITAIADQQLNPRVGGVAEHCASGSSACLRGKNIFITDYKLEVDVATELTHEVTHTLMDAPRWQEETSAWARELTVFGRMPDALRIPQSEFYFLWFSRMLDPAGFDRRTCQMYGGGSQCK